MYCYKCGNKLPSVAKFCNKCGTKQIVEENNVDKLIADDNQVENAENDTKELEKNNTENQSEESSDSTIQITEENLDNKANEPVEKIAHSASADEKKESSIAQVKEEQRESNKGKSNKLLNTVIILGLVVAFGIILILVISNRVPKVNLNNYVNIVVEGCDGYGTAHFEFDDAKFYKDYEKKIKFVKNKSGDEYEDAFFEMMKSSDITPAEFLNEYLLAGSITPKTGLSNGDEVTFSWSIDEEFLPMFKAKFVYDDVSEKVKGLDDIKTFDAFGNLQIEFNGFSSEGKATIVKRSGILKDDCYTISKDSGLSNGDAITVSVKQDVAKKIIEGMQQKPEKDTREYVVSGLSDYVTDISEISEKAINKMNSKAVSYLADKRIGRTFDRKYEYREKENKLIKHYLVVNNEDNSNYVFLIYKNTVNFKTLEYNHMLKEFNKDIDYYSILGFQNITVDDAGNCSFDIDKMWIDEQRGKYVEKDIFQFGGIVFDAEIDYTGYDSLERAESSLRKYTTSKYNMYESIDTEEITATEDEIDSPVMKGEFKWTYDYTNDDFFKETSLPNLPDQILDSFDCFNDWWFTETEEEEKHNKEREQIILDGLNNYVKITNESLLRKWGFVEEDVENLKYSYLFYNEFFEEGDLHKYEISLIDNSFGEMDYIDYDNKKEICRYFGIVTENGNTLFVSRDYRYNEMPGFNFTDLIIDYE